MTVEASRPLPGADRSLAPLVTRERLDRRSPLRSIRRRSLVLGGLSFAPLLAACASGSQPAASNTEQKVISTSAPTSAPPAPTVPPSPTPIPINPLTGQPVADASKVRRRIVAVKIDNAPEARPPVGMSLADMWYEELAEGGLTRFISLFLTQDPERVGPVRSARLTDIYLGEEWEWLLAYAGAGTTTGRLLGQSLVPVFKAPELGEKLDGTPYFREPKREVPHNLFVRTADIRAEAAKDPGIKPEVEIRPFPFQPPLTDIGPVRAINLPYIPMASVKWSYDTGANVWKRTMSGVPHVDELTGQQLQATNVVVQYARLFTAQNVEPDPAGNPVLDADLRGENKLRVFHSGQVFEGTWVKENDRAKTQYKAADGGPMPFRPGTVWIHIVPTDFNMNWV